MLFLFACFQFLFPGEKSKAQSLHSLLKVTQPVGGGPEVEGSQGGTMLHRPGIECQSRLYCPSLINQKSSLFVCFINGDSSLVFFEARVWWLKKNSKTPGL